LTNMRIFSLEGMAKICCHSSVFLISPTPTHDNSFGVDLKISIFWFAHPTDGTENRSEDRKTIEF